MPKQLLNNSKSTLKKSIKRLFWPKKRSKWPSQRAKFWTKILILEFIYRAFELKIQLKVGILRPKMMPKPLLNNSKTTFKKSKKRPFWPPKWSKWPSERANFWPKILILEVIYRPFGLKMITTVGLLIPKTMPKQLLNISKTTFKKAKNDFFGAQNGQNGPLRGPIFDLKFWFLRSCIDLSSWKYS